LPSKGKTDRFDAENATRAALGAQAIALPKSESSTVELVRRLKVARENAVKCLTQSMLTIEVIVVRDCLRMASDG
jgi:hypothetical protein